MIAQAKQDHFYDEPDERHPVHLNLSEKEVAMYFNLLEERIAKHESLLKRVENTVYESSVKKSLKIEEHTDKIRLLSNMLYELKEQSAW